MIFVPCGEMAVLFGNPTNHPQSDLQHKPPLRVINRSKDSACYHMH